MEMKNSGSAISLATIYNNLITLVSEKKICKITESGKPDRYDNMTRHDHLFCDKCGKIIDVDYIDLTSSLENLIGQKITSYDLQIHYICKDCQEKIEKGGHESHE